MSAQYAATRVRLGVLAFPVCGLLFVVVLLVRGPLIDPSVDPAGFAQATSSATFVVSNLGLLVSWVLLLFGFMALYAYLANTSVDDLAFAGMVLSLVGVALFVSFIGVLAFIAPAIGALYEQGQQSAIEVFILGLSSSPLALSIYGLGALLYVIGSISFGLAVWRSGTLPRWSAIPYAAQAPLLPLDPLFGATLVGALLLFAGGGGIAVSALRRPPVAAGGEPSSRVR